MVAPSLTEALVQIATLQTQLAALTTRVTAIESTANSNKARLDALDHFKEDHSAGAAERQREVDRLQVANHRIRWAMTHGRMP